jgi:hypothetical protein
MTVSHQPQSVSLRARAAGESIDLSCRDVLGDSVLRAVMAAGRRGAEPAAITRAIMLGWQWLATRSVIERRALQAQLRDAIARGHTTARAWLPLALAETDPLLLRAAVNGYLGSAPRSVEQRGQALDDVIEWFRRGLALDRVTVFVSLLMLREPGVNERLAPLRGRLTDAERERALRGCAGATDTLTCEFIADWCGEPAIAPVQPD